MNLASVIIMVIGITGFAACSGKNNVHELNLDTYSSFTEIVSASPRATYDLYDGNNTSSINLSRVSQKFGTQFNVYVEEGLEGTWKKLKKAYDLNPPSDWVKTGLSKDDISASFTIARNMDNARILFLTKTHDDYYVIFKQNWAGFVQDPKNILKKK